MRLCLCVLLPALLSAGCATAIAPPPDIVPPAATDLERRLQAYVVNSAPLRDQVVKQIPEGKTPEEQAKTLERRRTMLAMSLRTQRARARPGDLLSASGIEYIRSRLAAAAL